MNTQPKFWKKRPAPYWCDIRAWSLIIPAMAAALGGIAYSIQGLAVSQGGVLPAAWVDSAIAWGAVLLGVGCEGGTISACIEIARKRRDGDTATVRLFGRAVAIDGIGLVVSYCATVVARMLALRPAQSVAVIGLLVVASVADAYFLFTEAGEYLSIRDRNVARWETARWYYEEQRNLPAALAALRSDEPVALSDEVRGFQEQLAAAKRDADDLREQLSATNAQLDAADAQLAEAARWYYEDQQHNQFQVSQPTAKVALEVAHPAPEVAQPTPDVAKPAPQPAPEVAQLPSATIESWRKVYQSYGNNGSGFVTASQALAQGDVTLAQAEEQVLRKWLATAGLAAQVSETSLRNWRKEAREWCEYGEQ